VKRRINALKTLSALAGAGAVMATLGSAHAAPCYIAYVHGSSSSDDNSTDTLHEGFDNGAGDRLEGKWRSNNSIFNSFTYYSSRQYDPAKACAIFRVGYNGKNYWWENDSAGVVATQLNQFIDEYNIPDGQLIIVTHSMGGLVTRWILDNGVANSPYFNYNGNYSRIVQKTKYQISVQAPHGGTQVADAIYGEANNYFGDAAGAIARWFGGQDRTNARNSMRRSYMGDAATWMGDAGRYRTIYSIAGDSTENDSGTGTQNDKDLQTAWSGVCYRRSAINGWGSLCGSGILFAVSPVIFGAINAATFDWTPGDGLVEQASGHGRILRPVGGGWRGATGPTQVQGAFKQWLTVRHNHNHARYDELYAPIVDGLASVSQNNYVGSYIGTYGTNLPCSAGGAATCWRGTPP
jgi:hypothetical protein